ncbi:hypothetical protein KVV02_006907 [Mortierella alpina]|uniref:RRM domain-containing protein n=1 Tax=Mortierella alpina TaxID=64518 RepID=A0A9P8CWV8_MORAP|nr:hypothetical protein KVV02_006907 [Mortierella alpina]
MSRRQTTLFVSGFSFRTRARDLAYEFERYGPLVRCDIPAPRNNSSKAYAFVEFEDYRDCEDAYYEMRDFRFDGYRLDVQYAKNNPSSSWRYEHGGGRRRSRTPPRRRSPSPLPYRRSLSPRRRSMSPRGRSPSPYGRRPRSPSPVGHRRRSSASRSPVRGRSEERKRDQEDQRASSPRRSRTPDHGPVADGDGAEGARSISPRPRSVTP